MLSYRNMVPCARGRHTGTPAHQRATSRHLAVRNAEGGRASMIPRELVALLERRRLVAEVRTSTAIQALSVVDALAAGGVTTIEVSLTIPGAHEILGHLATRSDVLVGAGAVLDSHQAKDVISYGARFIASPIL